MDQKLLLARIQSKVKPLDNGCIVWTGCFRKSLGKYEYGQCRYNGKAHLTHRLFYELAKGPIPPHLEIDHICRNSKCVNVDHLRATTHKVNCNNKAHLDRTHCNRGHELFGDNLTLTRQGWKKCKACIRENVRKWAKLNPERYLQISRKSYYKLRRERHLSFRGNSENLEQNVQTQACLPTEIPADLRLPSLISLHDVHK